MAITKATYTGGEDFASPFLIGGKVVTPYQKYNGETLPSDVAVSAGSWPNTIGWVGAQPTIVQGVVGNATKFAGNSLKWANWNYPAMDKATISFWVKLTAADLTGWKIFATNRGDGYTDGGLHVAAYNGDLNVRAYNSNGTLSVNVYAAVEKKFVADKWYHVAVVWDYYGANQLEAYIDGVRVIASYGGFALGTIERSLQLGNMGTTYPFYGTMDEFMYMVNTDAWTATDVLEYYNRITNGLFFDDSVAGELKLGKGVDGLYPELMSWTSKTLDLGGVGKFLDYGYLEAVGQTPAGTSFDFFTRTSADNLTWGVWSAVDESGTMTSVNQRYVQVRVDFISNGLATPILEEIRVCEEIIPIELPKSLVKHDDPLFLYNDKETGLDSVGEIPKAYDIVLDETINGEESLTFKLPYIDKKRKEIGEEPVEMVVSIGRRYFVVKEILDKRDDDGKLYSEFICEARWTELRDWYVDGIEMVEVEAKTALNAIIASVFYEVGDPAIDWTIGTVEITKKRTLRNDKWTDVLTLIREVQNTWGGEVLFDNETKVVHLVETIGANTGIKFTYKKNLKSVERRIDTYDLITRIYPTGAGGLDVRTVNDGKPYIENRIWVDRLNLRRKIIPYKLSDERYTIPQNLFDDGKALLDEMAKPNIAYTTTVHDLSSLTGHKHETFELGDTIIISDSELFDEEIENRIVRRQQNVRKPEETVIEISQPTKTLADIQSRSVDEKVQTLIASDLLSNGDVQQMTVFNQLLNSRGDDGVSSWVNEASGSAFELANTGFSGSWAYKVTPDFEKSGKLTQTVEGISHRSTYTVSASVATEGSIVRGSSADAFIGIKVLVYYEGETEPEEHLLAIPDITTTESGGV